MDADHLSWLAKLGLWIVRGSLGRFSFTSDYTGVQWLFRNEGTRPKWKAEAMGEVEAHIEAVVPAITEKGEGA